MKKKRLLANIITLVFAISVMSFGIYAAYSANLTMTGTVGFIAHNVDIEVLGTISNAIRIDGTTFTPVDDSIYEVEGGLWYDKYSVVQNGVSTDQPVLISGTNTEEWNFGKIYFDDIYTDPDAEIQDVVITLQVTNKSAYPIRATIDDSVVNVPQGMSFYAPASTRFEVNETKSLKMVVSLTGDADKNAEALILDDCVVEFEKIVDEVIEVEEDAGWLITDDGELYGVPTAENYGSDELVIPTVVNKAVDGEQTMSSSSKLTLADQNTKQVKVTSIGYVLTEEEAEAGKTENYATVTNFDTYKTITIPEGVTILGDKAFYGCSNLETVNLPESLQQIQTDVFTGCTNLIYTSLSSGNYLGGLNIPNTFALITGPEYASDVEILPETKVIANDAYRNTQGDPVTEPDQGGTGSGGGSTGGSGGGSGGTVTNSSITVSKGTTKIPANTFSESTFVNYVEIPGTVEVVEQQAFKGSSITHIIFYGDVRTIGDRAFYDCPDLHTVEFRGSVQNIGASAFANCPKLNKIVFEKQVGTINDSAFTNTTNIKILQLGDQSFVDSFTNANANCKIAANASTIYIKNTVNVKNTSIFKNNFVTTSSDIENYTKYVFAGVGAASGYVVNASGVLTSLPTLAQNGNSTYIEIPKIIEVSGSNPSKFVEVKTIGSKVKNASSYKQIVLPETVTSLTSNAFYNCSSLLSITLPEGLTSIGSSAFYRCTNLNTINLPETLQTIDSQAFYYCSSISSIKIGSNITTIGYDAFYNCSKLSTVYIENATVANSLTSYSSNGNLINYAKTIYFANGLNVENSTYLKQEFELNESLNETGYFAYAQTKFGVDASGVITRLPTLAQNNNSKVLTIPSVITKNGVDIAVTAVGSASSTTRVTNAQLYTKVIFEEGIPTINQYAFYDCDSLIEITIPGSVTKLGKLAFSNSYYLATVNLASSAAGQSSYSNGPFYQCSSLKTVNIDDSLQSIGSYIFYYTNIEVVNISDNSSLQTINQSAFGRTKIKEIKIPESVQTINSSFSSCENLKTVYINSQTIVDGLKTKGSYYILNYADKVYIGDTLDTSKAEALFTDFEENTDSSLAEDGYSLYTPAGFAITRDGTIMRLPTLAQNNNSTTLTIPSEITRNGETIKILKVYIDDSVHITLPNATLYTNVIISEGIKTIGGYAFRSDILESISLPSTLTTIHKYAFANSKALSSIDLKNVEYIGENAFASCESLENVVIPTSVTSIRSYAFSGCTNLKSVKILGTISALSDYIFLNCTNLTELELPTDGLVTIGNSVFSGCTALTNIELPNSITSIGQYAFNGCTGLTNINLPTSLQTLGKYAFNGCTLLSEINIPSTLTAISENTFANCTSLQTVNIPDDSEITTIGNYAFVNCKVLSEINLTSKLSTIGVYVFYGCSELKTVYLASSVSSTTGYYDNGTTYTPFENSKVETVIIKDGLESIGNFLFYKVTSLKNINFDNNTTLLSIGGSAFNTCTGLTTINLPNTLTTINNYSFNDCSNLTEINFPQSLNKVGISAFDGCSKLTSITIPNTLTNLGSYAFNDCSSLQTINLQSDLSESVYSGSGPFGNCTNLTTINIADNVTNFVDYLFSNLVGNVSVVFEENRTFTTVGNYAFYNSTGLQSIELPNTTTSIGEYAFYGCTGLTSIDLPQSLETIGQYAFAGSGIEEITLPSSLTSVANYAFDNCSSLQTLNLNASLQGTSKNGYNPFTNSSIKVVNVLKDCTSIGSYLFYNVTSLTSVVFVDDCTISNIGDYAFYGCTGLTEIKIPKSIQTMGIYVFEGCTNLTTVNLASSVSGTADYQDGYTPFAKSNITTVNILEELEQIGENMFYKISSITTVNVIGNSQLTSIGNYTFYGCTGLTEITIPSLVTSIGYYAFYGCTNLETVNIGEDSQLTSIGNSAFYNCSKLAEITIPSTVTKIENSVFYNCSKLTGVTIPSTVTSIGNYAFYGCTSLTEMTIPSLVNSIGESAFYGCVGLTQMTIPSLVTKINSGMFNGCTNLTEVVFQGLITEIGPDAFNSTNLSQIALPETVTEIGYRAFNECTSLSQINLPNSIDFIGGYAFYNCASLTQINLPSELTYLGENAFYNCIGITEITIPSLVEEIYNGAFYGCENLDTVIIDSLEITNLFHSNYTNGYVINYATTVYIKTEAVVTNATYLKYAFTKSTDESLSKPGYYCWVRKTA